MESLSITELAIPSTVESPDAADFRDYIELGRAIQDDELHSTEDSWAPVEELPTWLDQEFEQRRGFLARIDGELVGHAEFQTITDSPATAWLTVEVLPQWRRRGVGSALWDTLLELAQGRTTLQAYALVSARHQGERMLAATGVGSVPLDHPSTRFLLARRFELKQAERVSRLALPADLESHYEAALSLAGPDYRPVTWTGLSPERYLDDLAALRSRMKTDAPWAGVEPDMSDWDADRLRDFERNELPGGRLLVSAAVEHVPTGRLAGFSQLSVPPALDRAASQYDTLVSGEHRGHRLGMLLKTANLIALQEAAPGHPAIITYNAEENRHMLAVNEQVGFVPVAYEGAWRLDR